MILSDGGIAEAIAEGNLVISPLDRTLIQPSSIDVRLGNEFLVFDTHKRACIDPMEDNADLTRKVCLFSRDEEFILHPGEFVLAATHEAFTFPSHLVGQVNGKSSLGRLGLLIHATAGFVDPGFRGTITLELSNVAKLPIKLRPMMKIAQISFVTMDATAQRPYGHPALGSKYQDQVGVEASRYHKNAS